MFTLAIETKVSKILKVEVKMTMTREKKKAKVENGAQKKAKVENGAQKKAKVENGPHEVMWVDTAIKYTPGEIRALRPLATKQHADVSGEAFSVDDIASPEVRRRKTPQPKTTTKYKM